MRRAWLVCVCGILACTFAVRAEPLVVITDEPAGECVQYAPAFSFDGQHLAWVERREPNGDSYIQVMEVATGATRRVPEEGRPEGFCWAPDRDVLAYVDACSPRDGETATLGILDLGLQTESQMPLEALAAHHLMWTPRGIQFVLAGGAPGLEDACHLARARPETGQIEFLTAPIVDENLAWGGTDGAFAWSPDGKSATLLGPSRAPFLHVWEDGLADFAPDNALAPLNLTPTDPPCLAVGPEGTEVFFGAFQAHEHGSMAVWRYRPHEADARPILGFAEDNEWPICLAVSQAGDRLAVISARLEAGDWNRAVAVLHVARLTDEPEWHQRKIDVEEGFLSPAGWPRTRAAICWSADGEHVAYSIAGQVRVGDIGTQTDVCATHLMTFA